LFARAIVLREGSQKLALVVADLNGIAGGVVADAVATLHDRGFDERNVIVSATHTHTGPGQYFNFTAYDTSFPAPSTPTQANFSPDPQMYGFMVRRLAVAIARADDNLGPGSVGWGHSVIHEGLTENRSIEAHLANFGFKLKYGEGRAGQDPGGRDNTIDPNVDLLRVDKVVQGRDLPVGAFATFANHGTVNLGVKLLAYSADHSGAAERVVEDQLRAADARALACPVRAPSRRSGPRARRRTGHARRHRARASRARLRHHAPRHAGAPGCAAPAVSQDVVDAFANSDEGDISSALSRSGPAAADLVGRAEATAILDAWRQAGQQLDPAPAIGLRWTRFCFCGQGTAGGGAVGTYPQPGLPLATGAEDHRGQLYETDGVQFEGDRLPYDVGPQGDKIPFAADPNGAPDAVPISVLRIGPEALFTVPGEATVQLGREMKSAVLAALAPAGVQRVALDGLAEEYASYFTTPAEYEWQAYEGGQTYFGTFSGLLVRDELGALAHTLAAGSPPPAPYPFDPRGSGPRPGAPPFPTGATSAHIDGQPAGVARLGHAQFAWTGGPRGTDRPLDAAFVSVQRQVGAAWQTVDDDLGLDLFWRVTGNESVPLGSGYVNPATVGHYTAQWEVPLSTAPGRYRFLVTANHYVLTSAPFEASPAAMLTPRNLDEPPGSAGVVLDYPVAQPYVDFTYRPLSAAGGTVKARVGGRNVAMHPAGGGAFTVPAAPGTPITIPVDGAHDAYGNANGTALSFHAGDPAPPAPNPTPPLDRVY
jgi:neutral ceramidase